MKRTLTAGALLALSVLLVAWLGGTPATAQCNGSMMGGCSGSENCHDPGEACTQQNCPGSMMGSCMEDTSCSGGMMGNCHEGGGGSPCPIEQCPMENCPMPEMCEMMGMMGGCEGMMGGCCKTETVGTRHRIRLHSSPNPFNPTTSLSFTLQEATDIELRIYDIRAREIAHLVSGRLQAGNHVVAFSAGSLPTGIYLARLSTPDAVSLQKLFLLK